MDRPCKGRTTSVDALTDQLPRELAKAEAALHRREMQALRECAHRVHGTIAAASSAGGDLASTLEDQAESGDALGAATTFTGLSSMAQILLVELATVSISDLKHRQSIAAVPSAMRILVAEDSALNAELLERLITLRGHSARVASDGLQALELLRTESFDMLLLDIHLPKLDGFSVIAAIRERERSTGGYLHVLAITVNAQPEDRDQCLAAGMDGFLGKPIRASDVWEAIERVARERPRGAM